MAGGGTQRVVVGQFAGPHGVRGAFKVRSFTDDPGDVAGYGPVSTDAGLCLTLRLEREIKPRVFLATAPEIDSPEDAEPYKGVLLSVPRDALPETPDPDEFYLEDLTGLSVEDEVGATVGRVKQVVNFGADDLLEVDDLAGGKGTVFLPFTKEAVPVVDVAAGHVVVSGEALEWLLGSADPPAGEPGEG